MIPQSLKFAKPLLRKSSSPHRDLAIDELVDRLANDLFKEVKQTDDLTLGLEMTG